ncbi:hypothetical protein Trydic_g5776 [Trypoxylus dichotomus]
MTRKRALPIVAQKLVVTKHAKPNAMIDIHKENKPKVLPNATKPPPYDYKARFNLPTEKHTSLQTANKDIKQELARFKSEFEVQEAKLEAVERAEAALKTELSELQEKYEILQAENVALTAELENAKERCCHILKKLEVGKAISSKTKTNLNSALEQQ